MNLQTARQILLVRAVEQADSDCEILSRAVRERATAEARSQPQGKSGDEENEAILARRAKILCERLGLQRILRGLDTAIWSWMAIAGAVVLWLLISGAAKRLWGNEKLVNVLVVPLLILFVWNLIYLAATAARILGSLVRGESSKTLLDRFLAALAIRQEGWIAKLADKLGASLGNNSDTWRRALVEFGSSWTKITQPLTAARLRFALHVAACALVVSEFAFVYIKGIAIQIDATWESTWLTPESTHAVLSVLLWPAHVLLEGSLPSADAIGDLRLDPKNAGPWIHLYLAQALIVVLVPRLILCTFEYFRAVRFERTLPLLIEGDRYYQNLVNADRGQGVVAQVVPYSFHPTSNSRDAIHDLLANDLGQAAHVEIDESIAYGEAKPTADVSSENDIVPTHCVLLFNLAQTPEGEVHGALISSFIQAAEATGHRTAMIVDAHAYRERLAGEPEIDTRLASRRLAWQNLAEQQGIRPLFLCLDEDQPESIPWS